MRIVFMGTPEFAVPSLRTLASSRHSVVAVVTAPDRPRGRGQTVSAGPVKKEALQLGLAILQPDDLTDRIFLQHLADVHADCFAVVGFRILPEAVFQMPLKGTVNLHASLLPQYRGAAPIQWALIHGEKETGVTTFFIRHRVDTGDIILQEKVAIGENETAGELHDRLARVGADVLLKTLDGIASNHVGKISQCGASSPAPKILSEHGWIHWEKSALEIHNLIRGLSPKPGAYTQLNGDRLKIYRSRIADEITESRSIPGTVVRCDKKGLLVQTGSGCLFVLDVHPEGKKKMEIAEFLCGRSIPSGIRLGDTDRQ